MFWDDLMPTETADWAAAQMRSPQPPPNLVFAPPPEQAEAAERIRFAFDRHVEISPRTGTVRIAGPVDGLPLDEILDFFVNTASFHRDLDHEVELRTDEQPPKFVRRQVLTRIEGTASLGPGGRMTWFDLPSGDFVDISLRQRAERVRAVGWRSPREVEAAVAAMVGDARGFRLRAAFGYSEPSGYEVAGLCRPSFVFVLDGPPMEGAPHWRVSIAVPASRDDDGDGGAAGRGQDSDWCV
ncbi:hypothetical protein AB0E63_13970 [Kribbella sp. NPDC026596]|uniref:hypothetical protein n=1 Tax=Kribbella sp. NPDC026596 TaxID=3155122 RepID=UPI0033D44B5A